MRVVLDTNILVSATFWSGDSSKILDLIERKEIELLISQEILEEFTRVLEYQEIREKVKNKGLEMHRTVEKIALLSIIVAPQKHFQLIEKDPDDDKFLDCAIEGNASFIVSQDKHLLDLKEFAGIKIICPKEFLMIHPYGLHVS